MEKESSMMTKWIIHVSGIHKLLYSMALAVCIYVILSFFQMETYSLVILTWDTFSFTMILLSWILFFSTTCEDLHLVVKRQDDGLKVIFFIVLVAICLSVFSTLVLLKNHNESSSKTVLHTIISLSPVLLSWLLLHTIFVIRYAHLFHDHNELNTGVNIGGIEFPNTKNPDYIDFAYFSFGLGMTFQVSDVVVTSRAIRRFVLMHSVISFAFNTIIVALTINAIAGLKL